MTKQLKRGDKFTIVDVRALACTEIKEITVDSIADDGRIVHVKGRKRFYLAITDSIIVLNGHTLGIKAGTWNDGNSFLIDANCNLGGLDKKSMTTLLKGNLNATFDKWEMIHWFDGVKEVGDSLFQSKPKRVAKPTKKTKAAEESVSEVSEPIEEKITEPTTAKIAEPANDDYSYLTAVSHRYDKKVAATNLRKVLRRAFPEIQFSVKHAHAYYYDVSWVDGPTVDMVNRYAKMFEGGRFDAMNDCPDQVHTDFTNKYGWLESVSTQRKVSEKYRMVELEILNKERGTAYSMNDYIADECCYVSDIIYRHTRTKDYTTRVEPKEIKPQAKKAIITPIVSEGLEIQDYSDKSFVVIGDTKPIKELLKNLGGRFNGFLKCGAGWVFTKNNNKLEEVKQALSLA